MMSDPYAAVVEATRELVRAQQRIAELEAENKRLLAIVNRPNTCHVCNGNGRISTPAEDDWAGECKMQPCPACRGEK